MDNPEGSTDCYLFVKPDFVLTSWTISSTLKAEKRFIKSGSAGMACPAHPKNKVNKRIKDWSFTNDGVAGKEKFKEGGKEGGVVVQCTAHDQCSTIEEE